MLKTTKPRNHPSALLAQAGFFLPGLLMLNLLLSSCRPASAPLPAVFTPTAPETTMTPTLAVEPAPTIHLPEPTPSEVVCAEPSGAIKTGVIETPLLPKPMRYNLYLPPCYSSETGRRYPVLYLLHGQNFDEGQWIRLGATSSADRLIGAGEIPPLIIVMPYDYSYKQPTEYNFEQVFLEILLPQIDQAYRTRAQAEARAVGGLSRGGAWAIHFGIRHPDLFGALGAHSPAVFYSDMDTMRLRLRDVDLNHFPRIFVDVGIDDTEYATALPFVNLLDEMNLPHEWHAYVGFHDEQYWSAHVEEYLRWYAAAWK
jgi:enterochelin esterase-like enzyme